MRAVFIGRPIFETIVAQAERDFPFETCGFIVGDAVAQEVRPVTNIQNRKHSEDPSAFPRDGRTAFLMDPHEQLAILTEIDRRGLSLLAVYHSHPDHDAYFSETDRRQACSFDPAQPDYPETAHVVLSVKAGLFERAAAFMWDAEKRDFNEAEIVVK